jgi:pimeloyl-ACP methyl ester carboxylesterase
MTTRINNPNGGLRARPHRFFTMIKRGLLRLGIIAVALIVLGCVYQAIATAIDKNKYPPPGALVDVDGHRMHIYCMGKGSPTVILEAGGFSFSSEWYWVQQEFAPTHRVCAYDRAGSGWSEPGPAPRTALRVVTELHTLLLKANVTGPYVLAGHSFGGILNRVYTTQYPDEVLGIVLVDTAFVAVHFDNDNEYRQWKRENDLLNAPLWALTRIGLIRPINASAFQSYDYPPPALAELAAFRSTNQTFDAYYAEGIAAMNENQQPFSSARIGDRPLMVLWATVLPRKLRPEEEVQLASLRQEVAAYSPNNATRFVEGADHGTILGKEQYARQVTSAILDVIESAQNGTKLSQN